MPPRRVPRNQRVEESVNNAGGQADPMRAFANMLAEAMQARPQPVVDQPAGHLANFKDFKLVGPPEFRGTTDPIEAQTWVEEIEKVFEVARVAEEQKTSFATFMMKGEANYWWKATKTRAGEGVVPWARFKELFLENYFPDSMQNQMEMKFLDLKQGNMSVAEYASKFNELARFAPHQVDTEARKARRFEQGLKPWVYSRVAVLRLDNFATLLERAIIAEGGNDALVRFNQDKKKKNHEGTREGGSGINTNPNKRKWVDSQSSGGNKSGGPIKKGNRCEKCGKNHSGECMKGRGVCYNCGQAGHIAPNCPKGKRSGCFSCGSPDH